jgi:hypothetical protein
LWQYNRLRQRSLFIQVIKNLIDDHRVFDAGDDFDGTTALGASLDIDIAYRDVGKVREQDAEAFLPC